LNIRKSVAKGFLTLTLMSSLALGAPLSQQEACDLGIEAYHYFYPLISMEITRKVTTNLPPGVKPGLGPMNAFHHMRAFPDAKFREVVRPNFDTLYSSCWVDLSREPMVVSTEDSGGRYYLLPMLDMWSDVFAVPGKRTSGTGKGAWLVCPPGWSGQVPAGLERIDAPTRSLWLIGRTQCNGPKDYSATHNVQNGFRLVPLSRWGQPAVEEPFKPDPTVDMKTPPLIQVDEMPASEYFALGAELMKVHPPHITDWSQLSRLRRLGIEPGKSFNFQAASPEVRAGLEQARKRALEVMKQKTATMARVTNGWQMNTDSMGVYGNYYLKRAIVAQVGLGANQPEDAIYPLCIGDASGQPLRGENKYRMHFSKAELPPVEAFWSVTMYDAQGFQVANPLNRFAIGDRDALKYNADGSLDLYIQSESPGPQWESNWLPAPAQGILGVTMRLYAPKPEALDGRWNPPAIQRVP